MRLLPWPFGRPAPDDSPAPTRPQEWPQADAPKPAREASILTPCEQYGSGYTVAVVNGSDYQDHLRSLCGVQGPPRELRFRAFLHNEDDNPYDDLAVRVEIQRRTVGYLSLKDARAYRQWLARECPGANVVTCEARVRGGRDWGEGDQAQIEVWLDLPIWR